ncbi:glycerophosphodiester phosphodiesterase family protein [Dyadobacter luticola]|uniref:Glycerophosphodiester phosphodiesterase family protein n=1 Tax=Dyadobacter luticola TaxID=1979387 RepID=A0A5R9KV54_9BACT|nr:glycerophosphodiester phosphodiesterase family protein [Dyadobacter luticola]TLV00048.1 glycerophosphodiester phosphodiesterase family protein [Dyadobacter luticola]
MSLSFKKTGILFLLITCALNVAAQQHAPLPKSKNKIVVIAHRGNHVNVPENTLASYKEAINCGADYVEVDLRTTKDGHLVVLHDATVDRTTNGSGKIAAMTFEEVEKLQVFNKNKRPHHIPEFREVLALCKDKINIYLDFKDADVAETLKQIKAAGMEHQVVVYLNKESQYKEWKDADPKMPLMTSLPKEVTNKEHLQAFLEKLHVQVLDNVADPELVKAAEAHGIAVWLDVQSPSEGPASWKATLQKGVHGLQSDKPAELRAFLKEDHL